MISNPVKHLQRLAIAGGFWGCMAAGAQAQQVVGGEGDLSQLLAKTAEAPQIQLRESSKPARAVSSAAPREPKVMASEFFAALGNSEVEGAFEKLTQGSNLAKRERDLTLFRERTRQVMDDYGHIAGYELLEEKQAGTNLLRCSRDRKSTRLNSSHSQISYAVFCLKKKKKKKTITKHR